MADAHSDSAFPGFRIKMDSTIQMSELVTWIELISTQEDWTDNAG